jgi:capsular polysaccharide transport system permease protein
MDMSHNQLVAIPKHSALRTQILVISALLRREAVTRFGKYRLGFIWMLLGPLLGVIVLGIIIGSFVAHSVPEIPYAFFLLNGMLMLKLLTGPMNAGINAISANKGLLVYPSVRPLDPFLARFLFELLTTALSFAVFCGVGAWMGMEFSMAYLQILAACFLLTWFMGCGLGLIFGVAAAYFNEAEKVADVLQRPLLFVSAVMFPTHALPESAQNFLHYNPLVHTIELSRKALFPYYHAGNVNLLYPLIIAVVFFSVGIILFRNHRNFLVKP